MSQARYDELIQIPRAVRFPVELLVPAQFDEERPETWPRVVGRLEWLDGRLLYMPPCGDLQQASVTDVVVTLGSWVRAHPGFFLGTNEAGMRLGGATRAADAAIWRRSDIELGGGLPRKPPLLAVEVGGTDDPEEMLLEKSSWYLSVGVPVVWIALPESREVIVASAQGQGRFAGDELLPAHPALPDLQVRASDFFFQISR